MAQSDDGGPAFPNEGFNADAPGMSLRDWFAGHLAPGVFDSDGDRDACAAEVWRRTDALLRAREEGERGTP